VFCGFVKISTQGDNEEIVSKMSSAVVRGFIKTGIIPCVKHFPGHGDTLLDSHNDLPEVPHSLARLDEIEFQSFKKAFRARVEVCMTAHLKLMDVDPENPATLSHKVLQGILRQHLGYRHIIITDDMEMKAITKHYSVEEAAVKAIKAGCNILLYCHELSVQERALEAITKAVVDGDIEESIIEDNYQRVLKLKKDNFPEKYNLVDPTQISKIVGHPDHLTLARAISQKQIPPGLTN
jgi:beta-N-acetylhexosaminidase